LKDNDDFELASDDELNDVIPDAKLKIYQKGNPLVVIPPPVPTTLPSQPLASSAPVAPVVVPAIHAADGDLVTKNSILNLTNLNIPLVGPEAKIKMKIVCPQIRKSLIEVPFDESLDSFLDLSKYLIIRLGMDPHLKAILYNRKGQPFLYNLDLMHMRLPKLDFSEELYVMFTDSSSAVD
jgi:hypothetical protein